MYQFKYLFVIGCMLNVIRQCHGTPGKRKRFFSVLKCNVKRGNYEKEHYEAYLKNADLYTEWPELKISDELNKKTCKIFLEKLFPKKNFEPCTVTPSIEHLDLLYSTDICNNLGHIVRQFVTINSLQCHISPSGTHRKFFHFIRSPHPGCVYLLNREKPQTDDFYISLFLCEHDTYNDLKYNELFEDALYKPKWLRRKNCRDADSDMKREEYEKNHQLWNNDGEAGIWPELEDENLKLFCSKVLEKLYPKTTTSSEDIKPLFDFKELSYTKMRNNDGFLFPLVEVIAISCKTPLKSDRGNHTFIRAPNHDSLSCVYMIRSAEIRHKYQQIIKRLCIQKLYENKGQRGAITTNTGVDEEVQNENVLGPVTTEGHFENSIRPISSCEEELISDEEILRHIRINDCAVSINELMESNKKV